MNTIKEKIMAIPNPYEDISRDGSHMFVGYERGVADSAEVAQEYVDALIAELREVCFDEQSGGYFHRLDIGGAEISEVLDKWSTK